MTRNNLSQRSILLACVLCLLPSVALGQPDFFVDASAEGLNDGSSWTHAFTTLTAAIERAQNPGPSAAEIWVAEGSYAAGAWSWESLQLLSGMRIYGGFQGGETLLEQRNPDPATNGAVLSGDLALSSVVVTSDGGNGFTTLDAFTITGALQHAVSVTNGSRAQFVNLLIQGNNVSGSGAGMYIDDSDPKLQAVDFIQNHADSGTGGAVSVTNGSVPEFTGCRFESNTARWGGAAIYADGQAAPIIKSCQFVTNVSDLGDGGAIHLSPPFGAGLPVPIVRDCDFESNRTDGGFGGAIRILSGDVPAVIVHCTFLQNSATLSGGAIYSDQTLYDADRWGQIISSTFAGNTAGYNGGAIGHYTQLTMTNCAFSGNQTTDSTGNFGLGGAVFGDIGSKTQLINATLRANAAIA